MFFLRAAHLARTHGYSSCLLLPDDHLLYTTITNTVALFASCEEVEQVHHFPYSDLFTMNEHDLLVTLQKSLPPMGTETPKKRRRSAKEAHS